MNRRGFFSQLFGGLVAAVCAKAVPVGDVSWRLVGPRVWTIPPAVGPDWEAIARKAVAEDRVYLVGPKTLMDAYDRAAGQNRTELLRAIQQREEAFLGRFQ